MTLTKVVEQTFTDGERHAFQMALQTLLIEGGGYERMRDWLKRQNDERPYVADATSGIITSERTNT